MSIRPARRETGVVSRTTDGDVVRGRLGVAIDPETHCETLTAPTAAEVLWQDHRVREDPGGAGEVDRARECHTELCHTDGDRPRYEYRVAETDRDCLCPLLADSDCLARPERIRGETLVVSVTARSGERFRSLVGKLRERSRSVDIVRVQWNGKGSPDDGPEGFTECQVEAVETAIAAGYYENPRTATLEEVADRLGITKSATSQRLNAAERKLVESAFGQ
jgi:predicted DNA binding protein